MYDLHDITIPEAGGKLNIKILITSRINLDKLMQAYPMSCVWNKKDRSRIGERSQYGAFAGCLYFEVSESLIGFSHTVCIFFLFESTTFAFGSSYYFISQFLCHATAISFAAVADEPFNAQ